MERGGRQCDETLVPKPHRSTAVPRKTWYARFGLRHPCFVFMKLLLDFYLGSAIYSRSNFLSNVV